MIKISKGSKFIFAAVAISCGAAIFGGKITESRAQTSGLSGKYGCLENGNAVPIQAPKAGSSVYMNTMVYIDFDAKTYSSSSAVINSFNQNGANQTISNMSGRLTISTGPITGSYSMVVDAGLGDTVTLMPVNSGNTILYANASTGSGSLPSTGVCQKI
jgi:hypothetical protein